MGYNADEDEIRRFRNFSKRLTELSKETGFVLKAVGGVYVYDENDPYLETLYYSDDLTSLDLVPEGIWDD